MISVFYHVYTINHYQSITNEFLNDAKELIEECDNFFVCKVGNKPIYNLPEKTKIVNWFEHSGELETLNFIKSFCKLHNSKILYCHSKGVTTSNNSCIDDWRSYMFYFLLNNYKKCLTELDVSDTCGVDLVNTPVLHYSGNCWWSKSSHINTLNEVSEIPSPLSERHKCEFWITSKSDNHFCFHQSNINVYERHLHNYPSTNYIKD